MIAAVLLAAGASRRLGRPKALLRMEGSTLVRRAAAAALDGGCTPLIVVLGADAAKIRTEVDGLDARVVVHAAWREGMAASIRAGVGALFEHAPAAHGVLLLACDQPRLDPGLVRRVVAEFDGRDSTRVACAYAGTFGIPALFGRGWWPDLSRLAGDRGARSILEQPGGTLRLVPWPDGATDIDTPADRRGLSGDPAGGNDPEAI